MQTKHTCKNRCKTPQMHQPEDTMTPEMQKKKKKKKNPTDERKTTDEKKSAM